LDTDYILIYSPITKAYFKILGFQ